MGIASYCSPKTESRESAIEGKGRFAKEAISRGEIIAIRSGHLVNGKQLEEYADVIDDAEHQIADDFYLIPPSRNEFEDIMCFINHSCVPNVGILGNIILIAIRDIEAEEELCLDYAMVFNNEKTFACQCGKDSCRKTITGKDWMNKNLQEKYGDYFSSYLLQKIKRQEA